MIALSKALFDAMKADAALVAAVGLWKGEPKIFTKRPLPDKVGAPVILAATVVSDVDGDWINTPIREVTRDIVVYGVEGEHFDSVVDIAEKIRNLFHRQRFSVAVPGFRIQSVIARGPVDAPAEPREIARLVNLLIRLQKE